IEMDRKKKKKKAKQDPFKGLPPAASTFTQNLAPAPQQASRSVAPVSTPGTLCPYCGWKGDDSDVFCADCGTKLLKR
nr:zinc ribbon domain-containing protein [Candidatus Sigynarchaeota archaeon]